MVTRLEFKEQEIPMENPNPPNDTYKEYGYMSVDFTCLFMLLPVSIWGIFQAWNRRDETLAAVLFFGGGIFLFLVAHGTMYKKYTYRKSVMKSGVKYPGVIVKAELYTRGVGMNHNGDFYKVTVKYADKTFVMENFEACLNPTILLENPYCTVYEDDRRVIATDFKVKPRYVKKNGMLRLMNWKDVLKEKAYQNNK